MNKNEFNIKAPNNWIYWLSTFTVGESQQVDEEDIKVIRVSITQYFHKNGLAKFTTKKHKFNIGKIIIKRVK